MTVSNCPRCNEAIRVPDDALHEDAYARCPWCRDTFPLTDVLAKLPPIVEVFSADGEPLSLPQQVTAAAMGGAAFGGGISRFAAEDKPSFMIEETDHDESARAGTFFEDEVSEDFLELGGTDDDDDLVGKATVTEETIADEPWRPDASESIEGENQDVGFALQDANDTWGERESSASVAAMRVSPSSSKKKPKSKFAAMRAVISVILGGALALPLADGILVLAGQPGFGVWSAILGKKDSSQGGGAMAAAAPAQVSADRPASRTKPSGRLLNPNTNDFESQTPSDPADAALEQIMGQPPSGPETVDAASAFSDGSPAKNSEAVTKSEPPIALPAAVPSGGDDSPALADASIKMPSADGDQESPVRMAPIESSQSKPAVGEADALRDESSNSGPAEIEPALPMRKSSPAPEIDSVESPLAEINLAEPMPAAIESADLIAATDRAARMVESLATFDGPKNERNAQLARTYAEIAAACDLGNPESGALRSLATTIANSPILSDIEFASNQWLKYEKRGSDGIALIGRPGNDGNGQIMMLESGKVVSVVGEARLPSAARVVAMGRVVDESTVELFLAEALP